VPDYSFQKCVTPTPQLLLPFFSHDHATSGQKCSHYSLENAQLQAKVNDPACATSLALRKWSDFDISQNSILCRQEERRLGCI
jgi:hypothetical protein